MNTVYEIMVRGATKSTINSQLIVKGEFSAPTKVLVTRDCDKIPPLMRRSSKELSAGVIAGMVCACFAVMLAITSFVLWKYGLILIIMHSTFLSTCLGVKARPPIRLLSKRYLRVFGASARTILSPSCSARAAHVT